MAHKRVTNVTTAWDSAFPYIKGPWKRQSWEEEFLGHSHTFSYPRLFLRASSLLQGSFTNQYIFVKQNWATEHKLPVPYFANWECLQNDLKRMPKALSYLTEDSTREFPHSVLIFLFSPKPKEHVNHLVPLPDFQLQTIKSKVQSDSTPPWVLPPPPLQAPSTQTKL